jgi:hypothetical protein
MTVSIDKFKVKAIIGGQKWKVRKELLAQYWHMPTTVTDIGWVEFLDEMGRRVKIYGLEIGRVKEGDEIVVKFEKLGILSLPKPYVKFEVDGKTMFGTIVKMIRS